MDIKKHYDVEVPTIDYRLKKVFEDSELEAGAVIRTLLITAADGAAAQDFRLDEVIAVLPPAP